MIIRASLKKEFVLLSRDLHSLLVLFLMPIVFLLIMSLALQENFAGKNSIQINGELVLQQQGEHPTYFKQALLKNAFIGFDAEKKNYFSVKVTPTFNATIEDALQPQPAVLLSFSPDLGTRERSLIQAAVEQAFALTNVRYLANDLGHDEAYARHTFLKEGAISLTSSQGDAAPLPSATQQNVPAWLVFAMFFVSIPISTTMIAERQQKTLTRLRTLAIPVFSLYFAKLLPYFVINFLQLALMLAVGAFILPLLGGEALDLSFSIPGLLIICGSVSIAALGFASLVATACKTTEQATIFSGVGSIVFGALGGIMVPTFVMPAVMQKLTLISPMGWGLQGFLDIILRNGTVIDIALESTVLTIFGMAMLAAAILLFETQQKNE